MKLKIVCWNIAYWSHMSKISGAWDFLYNELKADVVLLTEAGDIATSGCPFPFHKWRKIGDGNYAFWGSGIASRYELSDCYTPDCEGPVVTAEMKLDTRTLTLVSMYGLRDDRAGTNFITLPNLHRYLSDLTPIFNGRSHGRNIIFGGDWNADMQLDGEFCVRGNTPNAHKIFFDRVRDFKLNDCLERFAEYPVRTWRNAQYPDKVSQLDYCYASPNLKVVNAEVIETPQVRELSDHNPLMVEFEV
jgi:exonuclease III